MNKARSFLGELTADRKKAFPDILSLKLKIEQDLYGYYNGSETQRTSFYSESDFPRIIRCLNPRCQQGGLDLQKYLTFFQTGEYTADCNGHEGSPKGRRKGDPCDNTFKIVLDIHRVKGS